MAVYTPVKNEVKHVERWYESAKQADVLLMLDTGSEDMTPQLAASCGIVTHQAVISPFRFDDARNIAMSLVPPDIDIVLQLDADEVLEPGWREAVDGVDPEHNRWSYWLRPDHAGAGWGEVKRSNMHRRHGFRWVHPIHEIVDGPPSDVMLDDVVVLHKPDARKQRDYLDMMRYWSACDPDDARLLFYLGRELVGANEWVEAREVLTRYLAHPKSKMPGERSEAYLLLGLIDYEPERWFLKAMVECPDRREPFFLLAKHCYKEHRIPEATAWIDLAGLRTDRSLYTTRAEAWDAQFDLMKKKITGRK